MPLTSASGTSMERSQMRISSAWRLRSILLRRLRKMSQSTPHFCRDQAVVKVITGAGFALAGLFVDRGGAASKRPRTVHEMLALEPAPDLVADGGPVFRRGRRRRLGPAHGCGRPFVETI